MGKKIQSKCLSTEGTMGLSTWIIYPASMFCEKRMCTEIEVLFCWGGKKKKVFSAHRVVNLRSIFFSDHLAAMKRRIWAKVKLLVLEVCWTDLELGNMGRDSGKRESPKKDTTFAALKSYSKTKWQSSKEQKTLLKGATIATIHDIH